MEIRILKYFLAVVREGNITKAAESLWVTQPTLSRQLTQLEEEVGTKLLIRGKRKVTLTDTGMLFYKRAEEIVDLVEKTEKEVNEEEGNIRGTITIGSGELRSVSVLASLFTEFSKIYPDVKYDMYTGTFEQIRERMENGLIDFGLMFAPNNLEDYEFIRLEVKEKWVILMRPDSELVTKEYITPKDLVNKNVILPKRHIIRNEIENWFGKHYKDILINTTFNLPNNAAILVKEGLGYLFTLEGAVSFYDEKKLVSKKLYPEIKVVDTVLAWKKHQVLSKTSKKFLEFIKNKYDL